MTGSDLEIALVDINRVFKLLEDRISKLEKAPKPASPAKTITKRVTPKKPTNKA
ncbi:MAG: hypothetical protein JKY52_14420 [Flavobacteriales bacterium]|nr:hypothetical protein [Flavobacteriales bacterium]